ncbi:MAG TPA: DciA family protein [Candidatus Nanoarchaeia archaeon]|nr:DciA family protein [Candidatus Nanoarchaeia archaeon]
MLEPTGDYLKKRKAELGLSRGESLEKIQGLLDEMFAGQTRVASLNNNVLRITTPSAPVASEIRLRQVEILQKARQLAGDDQPINNLQIQIRA